MKSIENCKYKIVNFVRPIVRPTVQHNLLCHLKTAIWQLSGADLAIHIIVYYLKNMRYHLNDFVCC